MLKNTKHRSLGSYPFARITDGDLRAVVGGAGRYGQPLTFQGIPLAPTPAPPIPPPAGIAPPLSPLFKHFRFGTSTSGGTGQSPQHVVGGAFDNGRFFANAQVMTPAVPAIPPMPRIDGTFTPALQTHQFNAGFKFKW
jgi:hypothetical protein